MELFEASQLELVEASQPVVPPSVWHPTILYLDGSEEIAPSQVIFHNGWVEVWGDPGWTGSRIDRWIPAERIKEVRK